MLDDADVRIAVGVAEPNQVQRIVEIVLGGFLFRRHVRKELHPELQRKSPYKKRSVIFVVIYDKVNGRLLTGHRHVCQR